MNRQKDTNYIQMLVSGTALGGTEMEIITYACSHLPFPFSLPPFLFSFLCIFKEWYKDDHCSNLSSAIN